MSSQGRNDYPDSIHLVSVRGRVGREIFFRAARPAGGCYNPDSRAAEVAFWEWLLARTCDRYGALVHAYCWLPDEAVLLIQRFAVSLDIMFSSLLGQYSRYLHRAGRVPARERPYASRYSSIQVSPGLLPFAVRHVYWRAVRAKLCRDPGGHVLSSYRLHFASVVPSWFEQREFLAQVERRGYVGQAAVEEFIRTPERLEHRALFGDQAGRRPRVAAEPEELTARWRASRLRVPPSVEDVVDAVRSQLLVGTTPPGGSVLEKALIAWYATRSGAATLAELGLRFGCSPTTLRRDIESHRRKQPRLFEQKLGLRRGEGDSGSSGALGTCACAASMAERRSAARRPRECPCSAKGSQT